MKINVSFGGRQVRVGRHPVFSYSQEVDSEAITDWGKLRYYGVGSPYLVGTLNGVLVHAVVSQQVTPDARKFLKSVSEQIAEPTESNTICRERKIVLTREQLAEARRLRRGG